MNSIRFLKAAVHGFAVLVAGARRRPVFCSRSRISRGVMNRERTPVDQLRRQVQRLLAE